jgi:hypothetical protein
MHSREDGLVNEYTRQNARKKIAMGILVARSSHVILHDVSLQLLNAQSSGVRKLSAGDVDEQIRR